MTTKRELEKLARQAFGLTASVTADHGKRCSALGDDAVVQVMSHIDRQTERELLAAALRGIIRWKEGKE